MKILIVLLLTICSVRSTAQDVESCKELRKNRCDIIGSMLDTISYGVPFYCNECSLAFLELDEIDVKVVQGALRIEGRVKMTISGNSHSNLGWPVCDTIVVVAGVPSENDPGMGGPNVMFRPQEGSVARYVQIGEQFVMALPVKNVSHVWLMGSGCFGAMYSVVQCE